MGGLRAVSAIHEDSRHGCHDGDGYDAENGEPVCAVGPVLALDAHAGPEVALVAKFAIRVRVIVMLPLSHPLFLQLKIAPASLLPRIVFVLVGCQGEVLRAEVARAAATTAHPVVALAGAADLQTPGKVAHQWVRRR